MNNGTFLRGRIRSLPAKGPLRIAGRVVGWGLAAIPLAGFSLLLLARGNTAPLTPTPSAKLDAAVVAASGVNQAPEQAAKGKPAAPARIVSSPSVEPPREASLYRRLASQPELAQALDALLREQRPVAVIPREELLALRGTPEDVIELVRMYHSASDDELRDAVFSAACNLSNPDSADLLFELLNASGEPDLSMAASLSLARMADSTLLGEIMARYEAASTPGEQGRMLGVIFQIRNPTRVPALIEAFERQPAPDVSSALLQTLGMIGSPEAVEYLLERLGSSADPAEQAALADALSMAADPNALPVLIATAGGGSDLRAARLAAVRALGNFAPEFVGSLLNTMASSDPDTEVRRAAQEALVRIRPS